MRFLSSALVVLLASSTHRQHYSADAFSFVPPSLAAAGTRQQQRSFGISASRNTRSNTRSSSSSRLHMGVDIVTYLRTEWVSAALCTNQTPRSADVCLQLGTQDGRAVTFIPKTIRELITSSCEKDGKLTVSTRRQLKQQQERRENAATITYVDQRADNLAETKDESVDVVISLLAADELLSNDIDWKNSVKEAARVLKPGGRFLFVEKEDLDGVNYVDYVAGLMSITQSSGSDDDEDDNEDNDNADSNDPIPVFEILGWDPVDLCPTAHAAGVAIKSEDAGLTPLERQARDAQEEQDRMASLSIEAYERGIKKRKRRKKKKKQQPEEETADASS